MTPATGPAPALLAYGAHGPHPYLDQRAGAVARLYDGLIFLAGTWDEGVATHLGPSGPPVATPWARAVGANVAALTAAGAGVNLLGVHFAPDAPWPSAETLLSPDQGERLALRFGRLGACAAALGFHGVSIDIEYPYPRYSLEHEAYSYAGYGAPDLLAGARAQGHTAAAALIDAFPAAAVFVLPGSFRARPLERAFLRGLLAALVERDAPGGLHLGYERSYCLYDAPTQVAIPREGDCWAQLHLEPGELAYWRRRCTVAPGVWPLHMAETGAHDYPVRPWDEELGELAAQLAVLDRVAKRYVWSFSAHPVWHEADPALAARFSLPGAPFPGGEAAVRGWQDLLRARRRGPGPLPAGLGPLLAAVADFDAGRSDGGGLCDRFGTPGAWAILGPLGNPHTAPAFAVPAAAPEPRAAERALHGPDGVVRWFPYRNWEPTGRVLLRQVFDWRRTDHAAAQLVCALHCQRPVSTELCLGWDDGLAVWLDGALLWDRRDYGRSHGGLLYRDRLLFEERVPLTLAPGEHRLALSSLNAQGEWGFNLRLAGPDGLPTPGLRFSLPPLP